MRLSVIIIANRTHPIVIVKVDDYDVLRSDSWNSYAANGLTLIGMGLVLGFSVVNAQPLRSEVLASVNFPLIGAMTLAIIKLMPGPSHIDVMKPRTIAQFTSEN